MKVRGVRADAAIVMIDIACGWCGVALADKETGSFNIPVQDAPVTFVCHACKALNTVPSVLRVRALDTK